MILDDSEELATCQPCYRESLALCGRRCLMTSERCSRILWFYDLKIHVLLADGLNIVVEKVLVVVINNLPFLVRIWPIPSTFSYQLSGWVYLSIFLLVIVLFGEKFKNTFNNNKEFVHIKMFLPWLLSMKYTRKEMSL